MDHSENIVTQLIQEEHRSKWIVRSNHDMRCFTEDEIKGFTNNYETILGRGSFGEVFKGVLEDKSMVAVKRFICNIKENFAKELTVHRAINHKNVVRLVGYCVDENALMVVTEYIPKGNLSKILHHGNTPIALDTRLKIAIECAEALGYMHSEMYTRVIHGDIKPANILLDDGLGAKVSDFGISRLVNTEDILYTQTVIGSRGYMDPLFFQTGRLTPKSDVYSFGVMLLELITRKKASDDNGPTVLVERFTQDLAKGIRRVRKMFDDEIAIHSNIKTIEGVAKLSGKCLKMDLDKRPEMLEVAECLRKLRKASHQGQERLALFSRGRKNKLGPGEMAPSQESSSSTKKVGTFIEGSTMTFPFFDMDNLLPVDMDNLLPVDMDNLLRGSGAVLGEGIVGTSYKEMLESGDMPVVNKLRTTVDLPKEELDLREVIGAIEDEYIASLLWYYWNNDEKLLLYNFFPVGSLAHALHEDPVSPAAQLGWEQRVAIALAVARDVACIHSAGPLSCHGNINSSNVVLTGTHEACVSEHSLTALGPFPGASGYSAPEITDGKWVSQEADVYSFGVVLLELLTRKAPAKNTHWVCSVVQHEWAAKVIDAQLLGQQRKDGEEECMTRLLELAIHCCSEDANSRPTMFDVVQRIEKIQTSQESSSSSHYMGNAVPAESTKSQQSSSRTKNVGTFIVGPTMTCPLFVLADLAPAEVLGKGPVGTTYKVTLESGYTLVVKRLRAVNLPKEEFDLCVAVIGAIQNKHIAPLQWYYCNNDERLLVYNFFPMGSLSHTLHGSPAPLDWLQRAAIALAVARGVAYIHSAGPSSCHGNIKSFNVMLTGTHDACVSEHGLTTLGMFPGASVYSAPEITDARRVSHKGDVYSFGVLLLELLTGKDPGENSLLEDDWVNLLQWVHSFAQHERLAKVIDTKLLSQQQQDGVKECMGRLLELAIHCCSEDANSRPTMSDVVQQIEKMRTCVSCRSMYNPEKIGGVFSIYYFNRHSRIIFFVFAFSVLFWSTTLVEKMYFH